MSSGVAVEPTKRSSRQRKSTIRVFDDHVRAEIKRKRLESLEADNWHEDKRQAEEEEDDDYNPLDDASSGDGISASRHDRRLSSVLLPRGASDVRDVVPWCGAAMRVLAPHASLTLRALRPLRASRAEVAVDSSKRSSSKKKKKAKAKRDAWNAAQKCKSLQEILDEAEYHKYPSWVPNWASIAAAPSRYPPRHFCSVTGLAGKYKCPVTGDYLATLDAYTTHRETRLKGTRCTSLATPRPVAPHGRAVARSCVAPCACPDGRNCPPLPPQARARVRRALTHAALSRRCA